MDENQSEIPTKLEVLAESLGSKGKEREAQLRPKLLEAWRGFKTSRFAWGKALHEYRELYRTQKRNKGEISRFDQVLDAIGCERSKGYQYIRNYEQALKIRESLRLLAEERGIDLVETRHARLVSQLQERSGALSPDNALSDAELLDKCVRAVRLAREAAAPTVAKETGPVPVPALKGGPVDFAVRKVELIQLYRSRYVSEAEADRAIDSIIVAALEAQLSKLPGVIKEAA